LFLCVFVSLISALSVSIIHVFPFIPFPLTPFLFLCLSLFLSLTNTKRPNIGQKLMRCHIRGFFRVQNTTPCADAIITCIIMTFFAAQ
jgi:hypothetical protein